MDLTETRDHYVYTVRPRRDFVGKLFSFTGSVDDKLIEKVCGKLENGFTDTYRILFFKDHWSRREVQEVLESGWFEETRVRR